MEGVSGEARTAGSGMAKSGRGGVNGIGAMKGDGVVVVVDGRVDGSDGQGDVSDEKGDVSGLTLVSGDQVSEVISRDTGRLLRPESSTV